MLSWIKEGLEAIVKSITSVFDYLNPTSDKFILKTLIDYLNPFSENFILKGVLETLQYINPFSDKFIFREFFANIGEMLSYINPFSENFFGKKIVEFMGNLLKDLFLPNIDMINGKIESIKSRFSFVDGVKNTINDVTTIVYNIDNSPTFTVSLPNNKMGINELKIIDLSWYVPYKKFGDAVICCFCYGFFFWRMFIKLPRYYFWNVWLFFYYSFYYK